MRPARRDIVSGIVVVAPLTITILALAYLIRTIADVPFVADIEPWFLRLPIVALVFVVVVMATGYAMRTTLGRVLAQTINRAINHIPILRVVFNATRLAVETAFREDGTRTRPVRVEAWSGLRVTAFDTGNRAPDGRRLCFFPTAPNITTGYVIEVEEDQIEPTGERIETALTRLLSAGFGSEGTRSDEPVPDGRIVEYVRGVELPDRK